MQSSRDRPSRPRWRRLDRADDGDHGLLDTATHLHRVRTSSYETETVCNHCLGEDRCRGRTVTGDIVGLVRNFLGKLCTHVLEWVVKLDLFCDCHTVIRDRGRSPLLLEDDVAALRTERHLDGIRERVHARLEAATGLIIETNFLGCHVGIPF